MERLKLTTNPDETIPKMAGALDGEWRRGRTAAKAGRSVGHLLTNKLDRIRLNVLLNERRELLVLEIQMGNQIWKLEVAVLSGGFLGFFGKVWYCW